MPLHIVDSHVHFWQPELLHYGWWADHVPKQGMSRPEECPSQFSSERFFSS